MRHDHSHLQPNRPTTEMVILASKILSKLDKEITSEDFIIPRSLMGTSVLVALLMDITRRQIVTLEAVQAHNLAHILLCTNPWILLDYLQDQEVFETYVKTLTLNQPPLPPLTEEALCPALTPLVVQT